MINFSKLFYAGVFFPIWCWPGACIDNFWSRKISAPMYALVCSTIQGRIDQVNQVLELDREASGTARYGALEKWAQQLAQLHTAVINKMA